MTKLQGNNISKRIDNIYIDNYPSLHLGKQQDVSQLEGLNRLRIKYWRKIAQQYEPFRRFYSKNITKTNDQMARSGMLIFEDFLNNNVFTELCKYIKSVEDNGKLHEGTNGYATLEFEIDKNFRLFEDIARSISETTSLYYKKKVSSLHAKITVATKNVAPKITGTLRWHADRFIPVINGVYFPFGCNWAPFERVIGSPILVDGSEELLLHHYNEVPTELLDQGIYTSYCKPNTFILGAHHMMHRQKPSASPGKRIAIYFEAYSLLSASDLIKNYARKNAHRLRDMNLIFEENKPITEYAKNILLFDEALFGGIN